MGFTLFERLRVDIKVLHLAQARAGEGFSKLRSLAQQLGQEVKEHFRDEVGWERGPQPARRRRRKRSNTPTVIRSLPTKGPQEHVQGRVGGKAYRNTSDGPDAHQVLMWQVNTIGLLS